MCRAVWGVVVAPDDDACKALRRACGADVQVVGMAVAKAEALTLLESTPADVVVLDARAPDASSLVEELRARDVAIVWVGAAAPEGAHHAAEAGDGLDDRLPGAITKALIARR